MKVLLLESYYGGSHRVFVDQLKSWLNSIDIEVQLFTLPPRHWKSRLQLAHIELVHQVNEFLQSSSSTPDSFIILTNSLMDIASFRSLLSPPFRSLPLWCYFHENQMNYPLEKESKSYERDLMIQRNIIPSFHLNQVLSANQLIFNSQYNLENTFEELETFLKSRPEKAQRNILSAARERSQVIPVGISECPKEFQTPWDQRPKQLLWNHRWEYDKNPKDFFQGLEKLFQNDSSLQVAILGENNRDKDQIFEHFRSSHKEKISHFGFLEERRDYWKVLGLSRILPVTSIHDFLGLSVLEAISAGVVPILPARMVYPELIPASLHQKLIYPESETFPQQRQILELLEKGLSGHEWEVLHSHLKQYSASQAKELWRLKFSSFKPI